MTRADALRPMHRSVLETHQRARGYRPRPVNMSTVALTSEQRECIERIALGIFTDMTNSGATLQETLAAVYLSGSENALAAYHEPANDEAHRRDAAGGPSGGADCSTAT